MAASRWKRAFCDPVGLGQVERAGEVPGVQRIEPGAAARRPGERQAQRSVAAAFAGKSIHWIDF
jgi:hypothetical protein